MAKSSSVISNRQMNEFVANVSNVLDNQGIEACKELLQQKYVETTPKNPGRQSTVNVTKLKEFVAGLKFEEGKSHHKYLLNTQTWYNSQKANKDNQIDVSVITNLVKRGELAMPVAPASRASRKTDVIA